MSIEFIKKTGIGASKESFTQIIQNGNYIGWFTKDEIAFGNCLMTANEHGQINDKIKEFQLENKI